MSTESKIAVIEHETYRGATEAIICRLEALEPEAEFAQHLMGNMAMVAGAPDGSDATGRAKLRLMTPEEVVERAVSISTLAYKTFREKGMTVSVPAPKPQKSKEEL